MVEQGVMVNWLYGFFFLKLTLIYIFLSLYLDTKLIREKGVVEILDLSIEYYFIYYY